MKAVDVEAAAAAEADGAGTDNVDDETVVTVEEVPTGCVVVLDAVELTGSSRSASNSKAVCRLTELLPCENEDKPRFLEMKDPLVRLGELDKLILRMQGE